MIPYNYPMPYYLIRVGEGSKYLAEAIKNNFVAIGWNFTGDLNRYSDFDDLKQSILQNTDYNSSPALAGNNAGQLYRFAHEMQEGDYVLSPLGKGEYAVGVVGKYFYDTNPSGTCPYYNRREVKWLDKTLCKDDMSTSLAYGLGSSLTIYSLDKYSKELDDLLAGRVTTPAEQPEGIRDRVLTSLLESDGREFEEFIAHLLSLIGFKAEPTQYTNDKGIDVVGILDVDGIAEITLRVQVKRYKSGTISNKEILAMRGALSQGEHACFITLSQFTKAAVEEAETAGKVPVKLIDGEDLAGLVLKHFDNLDEKYKSKFQIRKKKDFNIDELFEGVDPEAEAIKEELDIKAPSSKVIEKFDWDTLVCAAKESGFKSAFLCEHAWWAVTINKEKLDHIKYLAIYQVAPISAITHYGEVERIEPYEGGPKYKLYLKSAPIELKQPVELGENSNLKPQGPRYVKLNDIIRSKTLDELWAQKVTMLL